MEEANKNIEVELKQVKVENPEASNEKSNGIKNKKFKLANEMLHDREYMFDVITQDIHSLGKVVARKYKFLHLAYNVFMYGLILSVIAFAVSYFIADKII